MHSSSPPLKRETSGTSIASDNSTVRGSTPNPVGSFMTTQFASSKSVSPFPSQPSPYRDPISTAQLSRIRDQAPGPYPSPSDSSIESPPLVSAAQMSYGHHQHSHSYPEMPPPFQGSYSLTSTNYLQSNPTSSFVDHRSKKMRFSPSMDRPDVQKQPQFLQHSPFPPSSGFNSGSLVSPPIIRHHSSSPTNVVTRMPPTPAMSSTGADDRVHFTSGPSPQPPQEPADFRRLSVKSLLSDDTPDTPADSGSSSDGAFPGKLNTSHFISADKTFYGVDRGFQDLDLGINNDQLALNGMTPDLGNASLSGSEHGSESYQGFGFGFNGTAGFQEGAGYYMHPVTVSISKSLEPLPKMLKENPMNLLYFHHFLNHTARVLVPHDCSENPFKSILPQSKFAIGLTSCQMANLY